jgi:hypothetical protein
VIGSLDNRKQLFLKVALILYSNLHPFLGESRIKTKVPTYDFAKIAETIPDSSDPTY